MSKINQPDDNGNWPEATEGYGDFNAPSDARTALMTALDEQKALDVANSIEAFNAGLRLFHSEDTQVMLSEFSDEEIKAEYDLRFPF